MKNVNYKKVSQLQKKYPKGYYKVNPEAWYKLVLPGTIVYLNNYIDTGEVEVIIHREHKTPAIIEEQKRMAAKFNYSRTSLIDILSKPIHAVINPAHLTRLNIKNG